MNISKQTFSFFIYFCIHIVFELVKHLHLNSFLHYRLCWFKLIYFRSKQYKMTGILQTEVMLKETIYMYKNNCCFILIQNECLSQRMMLLLCVNVYIYVCIYYKHILLHKISRVIWLIKENMYIHTKRRLYMVHLILIISLVSPCLYCILSDIRLFILKCY